MRVAFLGPRGTYSHAAALDYFPEAEAVPCRTISDVFAATADKNVDAGVVPTTNSSAGPVLETQRLLSAYANLSAGESRGFPVRHALAVAESLESVASIASHEQALTQCAKYISDLGKNRNIAYKKIPTASTANGASLAAEDPTVAAICSSLCASVYGLKTLDEDIQDAGDTNVTTFAVIKRN